MYNFLLKFHSYWAYAVIILGLITFFAVLFYFIKKQPTNALLKKISFYATLSFHIQFLIGLLLFIFSPRVNAAFGDMGAAMKNSELRKIIIEHPLMMIAAVIFITIANASLKRLPSPKFKVVLFVLIALACVFAMIPWERWPA